MAVKSVIEIDVLDEKFKAFNAAFEKYKKSVAEQDKQWEKINKHIAEAEKRQKDLNKAFKDGFSALQGAAGLAAGIATSMASAAVSAAKWLALGAVGGGFGFGGLAASASDYRRQAQGLGVSTGQIRSANVTFGRYISPDQTLANIADIQADLSRRQILGRLGGQEGQNPAEMLPTIIQNAVNQFKAGGKTQQYAEAMGLTQIFSMDELRRLSSLSREELKKTIEDFKKDQELLKLDDATSRAWQDFWYNLKLSGNQIENSLIKNLVALEPKLDKLRDNITKVAELLITKLGNWLASPDFEEDTRKFIEGLEALANAVVKAAKFFGLIDKSKEEKEAEHRNASDINVLRKDINADITTPAASWLANLKNRPFMGKTVNEKNRNEVLKAFLARGYNEQATLGFLGGLQQESGFNPNVVNASGHYGLAQWDETRRKEFEKVIGKSIYKSTLQEQLQFLFYELEHKEKAAGEALRSGVTKSAGVIANLQYERPALPNTPGWQNEYGLRLNNANSYTLRVQNDTGGQTVLNTVPMQ